MAADYRLTPDGFLTEDVGPKSFTDEFAGYLARRLTEPGGWRVTEDGSLVEAMTGWADGAADPAGVHVAYAERGHGYRTFSPRTKREAVRYLMEGGSPTSLARHYGISRSLLDRWRDDGRNRRPASKSDGDYHDACKRWAHAAADAGWTKAAIARETGYSESSVSRWLGKRSAKAPHRCRVGAAG